MRPIINKTLLLGAAASVILFGGCGTDENEKTAVTKHRYEVTVTNLTASQPLSPAGVILHTAAYHPYTLGQPAGSGLEKTAEGGDLTTLFSEATASSAVKTTGMGEGVILPGGSETIAVESLDETQLSVVAMLVNTNDAFIGLDGSDIDGMAVGESREFYLNTYDAGTELNSESAATIPGPAGNGEGYNEARNDLSDSVGLHPGVLTADEGLSTSALTSIHRWDNPAALVSIVRTR